MSTIILPIDQTSAQFGFGCELDGVTYGFAPETLADPAPELTVDRMEDLAEWVLARP